MQTVFKHLFNWRSMQDLTNRLSELFAFLNFNEIGDLRLNLKGLYRLTCQNYLRLLYQIVKFYFLSLKNQKINFRSDNETVKITTKKNQ